MLEEIAMHHQKKGSELVQALGAEIQLGLERYDMSPILNFGAFIILFTLIADNRV